MYCVSTSYVYVYSTSYVYVLLLQLTLEVLICRDKMKFFQIEITLVEYFTTRQPCLVREYPR